jgi:WD40 repeat protein
VEADRDGRVVAVATAPGPVLLWEPATGQVRHTLAGHVGPVWDAAFGPDGRTLATAGQDGTVRLWNAAEGVPEQVLRAHTGIVASVRFSPDGHRLVTVSDDGTARVWAVDLDDLVRLAEARVTRELTDAECREHLRRPCG